MLAQAWAEAVQALGQASALDPKTQAPAYLAVLATQRLESGVPDARTSTSSRFCPR
jgi:hypothetical protein